MSAEGRRCHSSVVVMLLCACASGTALFTITKDDAPKVNLDQGVVVGATERSLHGRDFFTFKGIPYAQPPVGDKRFKAPLPIGRGEGLIDATKEGPECIQKNYLLPSPVVSGQEDCLYLNVYAPKKVGPELLPVMVYIHGGGWFTGSGTSYVLGPQHLLDKNVILVTFNYRLGALGFLSTGDEAAPGNYAMKDQVEVLRWVKRNIHAFGGDKHLVTIFGQSAGAVSAHYHMLSPLSRGLFHRVISQSGTVLSPWAWPSVALPVARRQGHYVDCTQDDTTELIECLRKVDANVLVETGDNFHFWSIDPLITYTLVVESEGPFSFLTGDPMEMLRAGDFARVPWMVGVVAEEGIIRGVPIISDEALLDDLNENWNTLGPAIFEISKSVEQDKVSEMWNNVTNFYLDAVPVNPDDALGFIDMYSDRSFVHGTHKSVLMHAAQGHDNIFMYKFNYTTAEPVSYQFAFAPSYPKRYGVSHCDDLLYLFSSPGIFPNWPSQPADIQVVDVLVNLWTNFAKHGDPTPIESTTHRLSCELHNTTASPLCDQRALKWSPVPTKGALHTSYLYIRNVTDDGRSTLDFSMETDLFKARMAFWDNAPLVENAMGKLTNLATISSD